MTRGKHLEIRNCKGTFTEGYFEGVSVTTVILDPGACGLGLRAALLATTSAAPAAPGASVAVFPKSKICNYLQYLSACGPPQTSPDPSPGPSAAQEGLQEPWEGLEERIFDDISVILGPELRFWGPKVCICMENAVRIHLDTSRGLTPLIKKSEISILGSWGFRAKISV